MKRGAKGQEDGHATKKAKVDAGPKGSEDEVRKHYEKGAIAKVRFPPHNTRVLLLTTVGVAHPPHPQGIPHQPWPLYCGEEGGSY